DGTFSLTSGGDVTQTASGVITIGGTAEITASGDLLLSNAGNDFRGPVNLDAWDITIKDSNGK
ncbi:MAG: hypothetical protein EB112_03375, partial [Actinobacteria bacterium]|nr:hypothetical protein [Actinomycetota bacterium]